MFLCFCCGFAIVFKSYPLLDDRVRFGGIRSNQFCTCAGVDTIGSNQVCTCAGVGRIDRNQACTCAGVSRIDRNQACTCAGVSRIGGNPICTCAGVGRIGSDQFCSCDCASHKDDFRVDRLVAVLLRCTYSQRCWCRKGKYQLHAQTQNYHHNAKSNDFHIVVIRGLQSEKKKLWTLADMHTTHASNAVHMYSVKAHCQCPCWHSIKL